MNPGSIQPPAASITRTPSGTDTMLPTATIFPSSTMTAPSSTGSPLIGTIRPPVIATVPPVICAPHAYERVLRPCLPGRVAHTVLMRELVQLALQIGVEREIDRCQAGVELVRPACPDDRRRNRLVGQHPGHREGHQADAGVAGQVLECVDGVELPVVPVAVLVDLPGVAEGEAGSFRRWRSAGMLARQQAAGDRVVGDDADAFLGTEREHFPLDLTEQQVVAGLDRVEAGQPQRLAPADGPHQLIGQEVRAAGVPDLALMN